MSWSGFRKGIILGLLCASVATSSIARAQTGPTETGDRPWAKGVSKERQEAAWEVFREGNALLKDSLFAKAADKYREALKSWDHPAIHYNLALALVNLDQPTSPRARRTTGRSAAACRGPGRSSG